MKYLRTGRFNMNLDGIQFEEVLAEADDLGIKEMVDDLRKPSFELLHRQVVIFAENRNVFIFIVVPAIMCIIH